MNRASRLGREPQPAMFNDMKKYIFIASIFLVLLVIFALLSLLKPRVEEETETSPSPTNVPVSYPLPSGILPGSDGKIIIGGKEVNNFFKFAKKINNAGDLELSSNQNNSIQYFPQFNIFILSVNKSPFNEGRVEVENEFLQKLGIDKKTACELPVTLGTPASINPENAGRKYRLSFCHFD